ncbi:hypothetical protein BDQ17DRAFT_231330 [Cyathus striatus]|nr:hypothetical protein BDQ17DRAFT_231330 [Cyathus striatus]
MGCGEESTFALSALRGWGRGAERHSRCRCRRSLRRPNLPLPRKHLGHFKSESLVYAPAKARQNHVLIGSLRVRFGSRPCHPVLRGGFGWPVTLPLGAVTRSHHVLLDSYRHGLCAYCTCHATAIYLQISGDSGYRSVRWVRDLVIPGCELVLGRMSSYRLKLELVGYPVCPPRFLSFGGGYRSR